MKEGDDMVTHRSQASLHTDPKQVWAELETDHQRRALPPRRRRTRYVRAPYAFQSTSRPPHPAGIDLYSAIDLNTGAREHCEHGPSIPPGQTSPGVGVARTSNCGH